jgi:hypothetical protein
MAIFYTTEKRLARHNYVITEDGPLGPLHWGTNSREDAAITLVGSVRESRKDALPGCALRRGITIGSGDGVVFAEIDTAGTIQYDPDLNPDSAYFGAVLTNACTLES